MKREWEKGGGGGLRDKRELRTREERKQVNEKLLSGQRRP